MTNIWTNICGGTCGKLDTHVNKNKYTNKQKDIRATIMLDLQIEIENGSHVDTRAYLSTKIQYEY